MNPTITDVRAAGAPHKRALQQESSGKTESAVTGKKPDRDATVFTEAGKRQRELMELIGKLKEEYPDIRFETETASGGEESGMVDRVLDEMGEDYVIFLSKEFLEENGGSESLKKKSEILIKCIAKLRSGGVPADVFLEEDRAVIRSSAGNENFTGTKTGTAVWDADQLPSPAEREVSKYKLSSGSVYRTSAAYSRMAGAKTKAGVQTVMQQARRDIASLKLISLFGDEKEKEKAKAAVRSLNKLLLRGGQKLKDLEGSHLTDTRRKRALEKKQREKALQAALELKRQKTARRIRDGALRTEGRLDELNIPGYRREKEYVLSPPPTAAGAQFHIGPATPAAAPAGGTDGGIGTGSAQGGGAEIVEIITF